MQLAYSAAIRWDEEAGVWFVSETDFPGLVAEAETQDGLARKIRLLIPELYDANRHLMAARPDGRVRVLLCKTLS